MKVGFIGLGHMGAGMAASLLKAGHDVIVYNRTRTKVEALVAQGAKAAASVSDACSGDAVITMLANDDAVESVVFSDDSIIGSLLADAIHICSSTISVALSERLEAAHAKAGQRFVAAPVFGRPDVAAAGQLFVVAAGAPNNSACTDPAEPDAYCEYDTAADDDLDDGVGELAAHKAIADESDSDEFTNHHHVSEFQRDA